MSARPRSAAPAPRLRVRSAFAARAERRRLAETIAGFYQRGWSLGTSGNYSLVLAREPLRLLISASGRDKGRMADADFVVVDAAGAPVEPDAPRPSAETRLHTAIAARTGAGAVLHTHSIWSTLLSDLHFAAGELAIGGYEMLKGLSGVATHEARERFAIFDNTQDIPTLADAVERRLAAHDAALRHGFLLRGHGLYTWGRDLDEARRHVEILEFLFEVLGRRAVLDAARPSAWADPVARLA